MQRSESCRGKQQESKFCHDGFGSPENFGNKTRQQGRLGNKVCQRAMAINEKR